MLTLLAARRWWEDLNLSVPATWVAQLVERLTLAQVMTSDPWDGAPRWAQRGAWFSLSLCPALLLVLSLK